MSRIRIEVNKWFYISWLVFIGGGVISFFFTQAHPEGQKELMDFVKSQLPDMDETTSISQVVFWRNIMAAFLFIFMGLLSFGVLTLLAVFYNGVLVGAVIAVISNQMGVSPIILVIFGLLPHGILELPAVMLAASLGIELGVKGCKSIFSKVKCSWGIEIKNALKIYLLIIVPALVIAALIEGHLTPKLIDIFLNK